MSIVKLFMTDGEFDAFVSFRRSTYTAVFDRDDVPDIKAGDRVFVSSETGTMGQLRTVKRVELDDESDPLHVDMVIFFERMCCK